VVSGGGGGADQLGRRIFGIYALRAGRVAAIGVQLAVNRRNMAAAQARGDFAAQLKEEEKWNQMVGAGMTWALGDGAQRMGARQVRDGHGGHRSHDV
jgi:hypothetical protein